MAVYLAGPGLVLMPKLRERQISAAVVMVDDAAGAQSCRSAVGYIDVRAAGYHAWIEVANPPAAKLVEELDSYRRQ